MFWNINKWLFDIYRIISIQEEETFFGSTLLTNDLKQRNKNIL